MPSWTRRIRNAAVLRLQRGAVRARAAVLGRRRRAPATESERDATPILLAGCHRSGTSLVRRIVDSHSRIACPAETLWLEHLGAAVGGRDVPDGLAAIGLTPGELAGELRPIVWRHMEAYLRRKGKRRWADKTPTVLHQLDGVDRLLDGRAQYVAIFRDGMDVGYSLGRAEPPWWQLESYIARHDSPFVAAAEYWADMNRLLLDFAGLHPDRVFRLRYEDLVRAPEPVLRELFAFLGEPWEPEVMDFNRHRHDGGLEDHHVSTTTRFEDNSGKHRKLPLEVQARMWKVVRPVMLQAGYDDRVYA